MMLSRKMGTQINLHGIIISHVCTYVRKYMSLGASVFVDVHLLMQTLTRRGHILYWARLACPTQQRKHSNRKKWWPWHVPMTCVHFCTYPTPPLAPKLETLTKRTFHNSVLHLSSAILTKMVRPYRQSPEAICMPFVTKTSVWSNIDVNKAPMKLLALTSTLKKQNKKYIYIYISLFFFLCKLQARQRRMWPTHGLYFAHCHRIHARLAILFGSFLATGMSKLKQ